MVWVSAFRLLYLKALAVCFLCLFIIHSVVMIKAHCDLQQNIGGQELLSLSADEEISLAGTKVGPSLRITQLLQQLRSYVNSLPSSAPIASTPAPMETDWHLALSCVQPSVAVGLDWHLPVLFVTGVFGLICWPVLHWRQIQSMCVLCCKGRRGDVAFVQLASRDLAVLCHMPQLLWWLFSHCECLIIIVLVKLLGFFFHSVFSLDVCIYL